MAERNNTESESYREEQGKSPQLDPREAMAKVPLAPSSGGILEREPPEEKTTADTERERLESGGSS